MQSKFTEEDYQLIERELAPLREAARKRCADREQFELCRKAFDFANEAHKNVRRRSGEPYILHPIAVAKIVVSEIGLGCKSICAALLHDVVEDTEYTVEDIQRLFGDKIASLVDGLTKIKVALDDNKDATSLQAENFKRILLTLNDDVRIILIKLADRLHNIRTIQFMPEYKRDKILSETMYIFIPLAHKLGLYSMKTEMENIWLTYREPEAYQEISLRLQAFEQERSAGMEDIISPIREKLQENGYDAQIIKRLKSPYSIWRKMNVKKVPFEEIFDIYAIRIVFKPKEGITEREQCWHIFSLITSLYNYKADRTRDWVKEPKANGYEALHLTVMSPSGNWVEIQIRSERMNSIAERGVAAHWLYKKNNPNVSESEVDIWLKRIREILENPDANAISFLDNVHQELITPDIYVFTHKGEPRNLAKGATALDFAYLIHSEIGNQAIAAKVNQKLVPLSTVLRNGDQIEIITSETGKPKREWLSFLQTSRAKGEVLDFLKRDAKNAIRDGQQMLENALNARGISERIRVMRKLLDYYKIETKDDFYNRVGIGLIDLSDIDKALKANTSSSNNVLMWGIKLFRPTRKAAQIDPKKDYILSDNTGQPDSFIIADCCSPIPGDNAVGFLNPDGTVTVHKKTCPVATDLASKYGDKVLAVKWSKSLVRSFRAGIGARGIDRQGMINDFIKIITTGLGINIRKMQFESHDGVFDAYLEVFVQNTELLDQLIQRLSRIRGVTAISRTDINKP